MINTEHVSELVQPYVYKNINQSKQRISCIDRLLRNRWVIN